jgi:hypothetical protein
MQFQNGRCSLVRWMRSPARWKRVLELPGEARLVSLRVFTIPLATDSVNPGAMATHRRRAQLIWHSSSILGRLTIAHGAEQSAIARAFLRRGVRTR